MQTLIRFRDAKICTMACLRETERERERERENEEEVITVTFDSRTK